jgi:hypothetical protein
MAEARVAGVVRVVRVVRVVEAEVGAPEAGTGTVTVTVTAVATVISEHRCCTGEC